MWDSVMTPSLGGGTAGRRREEPQALRKTIRQDSRGEEPGPERNRQDADGEQAGADVLERASAGVDEPEAAGGQDDAGLQRHQDATDRRAHRLAPAIEGDGGGFQEAAPRR